MTSRVSISQWRQGARGGGGTDSLTGLSMLFPKPTKTKRWNTKRKITQDIFDICLARDGWCVICGTTTDLDRPHHIFYWNMAEYWPDRNNLEKLVTICRSHHHKLHFEWGNNYRDECIQYLKNIWS